MKCPECNRDNFRVYLSDDGLQCRECKDGWKQDDKKQEKLPEPKCECGGKLDFFCKKMGSKYSNETKKYVYFSKCEECFAYTELLKTTLKEHAELKEKIIILVEN